VRRVGDLWGHHCLTRMKVLVVKGSGNYAYWESELYYQVVAGQLDLRRPLLAGQFVGGSVKECDAFGNPSKYPRKRVISLQFRVNLNMDSPEVL